MNNTSLVICNVWCATSVLLLSLDNTGSALVTALVSVVWLYLAFKEANLMNKRG